jgi:serralysin
MYTAAELALLRTMDPKALPGVDTQVGDLIATTKSLRSLPTSSTAGVWYNATENAVWVTKAGAVLDGYDFGNATILVDANNVTIKNSKFEAGGNEIFAVQLLSGVSGTTIENNTFNGGSATNPLPLQNFVSAQATGITGLKVLNNKFLNAPADGIDAWGGTITGNYFSGAGFSSVGTHPDAIWITNSQSPTLISNNFIDETWASGTSNLQTGQTNNAIHITSQEGPVNNVTVRGNVLMGGGYTIEAGNTGLGTFSNINILGNYIGFGRLGPSCLVPTKGSRQRGTSILISPTRTTRIAPGPPTGLRESRPPTWSPLPPQATFTGPQAAARLYTATECPAIFSGQRA